MTDTHIVLSMAPVEADQLARLVGELKEVIGSGRDGGDPAVVRLTPSPYPDDRTAAEDFHASTRDDLLDRRAADAETMLTGLSGLRSLIQEDAFEEQPLRIPAADIDPWMRTLTALRLVLASRLGIVDEQSEPTGDAVTLYDWLGYRLELLVQAADAVD